MGKQKIDTALNSMGQVGNGGVISTYTTGANDDSKSCSYTVATQPYSPEVQSLFRVIQSANLSELPMDKSGLAKYRSLFDGLPQDYNLFQKIFFDDKAKFAKLEPDQQKDFLQKFQVGLAKNPEHIHLSNQFAKVLHLPRNVIKFEATKKIGGVDFKSSSTGVANFGHDSKAGAVTTMTLALDALKNNPSSGNSWTFRDPEDPYRSVYSSFVDSGVAGAFTKESTFNQSAMNAAKAINQCYDEVMDLENYDLYATANSSVLTPEEKALQTRLTKKYKPDDIDALKKKYPDAERDAIKARGKILFTKSAAYHSKGLQRGKWADGNPQGVAQIGAQQTRIDRFVRESLVGKYPEDNEAVGKQISDFTKNCRRLYANDPAYTLENFRDAYGFSPEKVTDTELCKMVEYTVKKSLFDQTNTSTFNKDANRGVNNHILHLAASTSLLQSLYPGHAFEGCKSNKDRASMVRMMGQAIEQCLRDSPSWEMSDPNEISAIVKDFAKDNPAYLLQPTSIDQLHQDLKVAKLELSNMGKAQAMENKQKEIALLEDKIKLGNYLQLAHNFESINRPKNAEGVEEAGYYSMVTGLNALGTQGALAQMEMFGEGDGNSRGMMPKVLRDIYAEVNPSFLVQKTIDNYKADMNKGAKVGYLEKIRDLDTKMEKEKTKFQEANKDQISRACTSLGIKEGDLGTMSDQAFAQAVSTTDAVKVLDGEIARKQSELKTLNDHASRSGAVLDNTVLKNRMEALEALQKKRRALESSNPPQTPDQKILIDYRNKIKVSQTTKQGMYDILDVYVKASQQVVKLPEQQNDGPVSEQLVAEKRKLAEKAMMNILASEEKFSDQSNQSGNVQSTRAQRDDYVNGLMQPSSNASDVGTDSEQSSDADSVKNDDYHDVDAQFKQFIEKRENRFTAKLSGAEDEKKRTDYTKAIFNNAKELGVPKHLLKDALTNSKTRDSLRDHLYRALKVSAIIHKARGQQPILGSDSLPLTKGNLEQLGHYMDASNINRRSTGSASTDLESRPSSDSIQGASSVPDLNASLPSQKPNARAQALEKLFDEAEACHQKSIQNKARSLDNMYANATNDPSNPTLKNQ